MKWGKYFWTTFHVTAVAYPDQPSVHDQESYRSFYKSFGQVLPCPKCKQNYSEHLLQFPIEGFLSSKSDLFTWTVKVHNIVNTELGKPTWEVESAWNYYSKNKYADDEFKMTPEMWTVLIFGIVIVGAAIYLIKKKLRF